MCYFNLVKAKNKEVKFKLHDLSQIVNLGLIFKEQLEYDGFKYSNFPVLKANRAEKKFDLVKMEWGFLPSPNKWPFVKNREDASKMRFGYKDPTGKFTPGIITLNAIGEELLLPNKMYRDAALNRRCLVLSSGFVEWRHVPQIGKKGQPLKTTLAIPYYIFLPDQEYFYMLGIYNPWTDQSTGETVDTFAIVTTEANFGMAQIHNKKKRMPGIADEEFAYQWMFGNLTESDITKIATTQYSWAKMDAYTIAKDIRTSYNFDKFDYDPELVSPIIRAA